MSIEVRKTTAIMETNRVVDSRLVRSLLRFFEYEHFGIVSANLPGSAYTQPVLVDDFLPDVVATNRRGTTVYGVALECASLEDLAIIRAIQMLANRTQVYVIFHEACGDLARAMKQTAFAHNNVNLLFI